jgi:hypothetical protein
MGRQRPMPTEFKTPIYDNLPIEGRINNLYIYIYNGHHPYEQLMVIFHSECCNDKTHSGVSIVTMINDQSFSTKLFINPIYDILFISKSTHFDSFSPFILISLSVYY